MKRKICIAGATGWVGRILVPAIAASNDFEIVGAVSRSYQNQNLGRILQIPDINITLKNTVSEALKTETDILIDYTRPDAVKNNILTAIAHGVHAVVGTSGLTDEEYREIDKAARNKNVGVIAAGNFSISAVLLEKFAAIAARHMQHWEIVEYNSAAKPDAPSGTTRELLFKLSQVGKPKMEYPIDKIHGTKEARGATINNTQVHSVRLPGVISSCEILFGASHERLRITQEAGDSAEPYVAGTLLAAREVTSVIGLVRGLESFLKI